MDTNVSPNRILKSCMFDGANALDKSNIIIAIKILDVETPIPFMEELLGNRTLLNIFPMFLNLTIREGI